MQNDETNDKVDMEKAEKYMELPHQSTASLNSFVRQPDEIAVTVVKAVT